MLGVNVDDLGDHRPGQRAATEAGAAFPLVAAGFTKADVRAASQAMGLRTWDKPAAACLASRVPYGTEVTVTVLSRVERAEAVLRALGIGQVRVRHYGDTAASRSTTAELAAVLAAARGRRRRRPRRRLPLRDARSRGLPQRQPEWLSPSEGGLGSAP